MSFEFLLQSNPLISRPVLHLLIYEHFHLARGPRTDEWVCTRVNSGRYRQALGTGYRLIRNNIGRRREECVLSVLCLGGCILLLLLQKPVWCNKAYWLLRHQHLVLLFLIWIASLRVGCLVNRPDQWGVIQQRRRRGGGRRRKGGGVGGIYSASEDSQWQSSAGVTETVGQIYTFQRVVVFGWLCYTHRTVTALFGRLCLG